MNPERWQKVERLFHDALAIPAPERDAWLTSACGGDADLKQEVQSLLSADDAPKDVDFSGGVKRTLASFAGRYVPRRIGAYEILEPIGSGGMGTVYKAHRVDQEYHAIVAIKLVRPEVGGAEIVQRFRQERQILARLTHPSIARLLDGGTTDDGIPYIVMEYIEGAWITQYCQSKQLDLRMRLELFRQVCSAVDHAHQHFVVHRDIKPSNILIDRTGTPKLLDFGISKLLHTDALEADPPLTQSMTILTPHYASPEQVLGQPVTTRSDVYSLGTVLYELVTGVRAHRFEKLTPGAIEDAICRGDVPPPSTVAGDGRIARRLAGDLDNIVMRAIHKDPERRYESATALAEDIQRYLHDLPVQARPDTTLYRARKFVRRHRALVAATAAVVVASMIGAGISIQQARVAEAREQQVRGLAKVFLFDVHDSIKDLPGATTARQRIVENAVRYLDALAGSNPREPELLRELAAGYMRVGDIQGGDSRGSNLGQSDKARESYRKVVALLDRLLAAAPGDREASVDRAIVQRQLADIDVRTGGVNAAQESLSRAVDAARDLLARHQTDRRVRDVAAGILAAAGRHQRDAGNLSLSLALASEALEIIRGVVEESPQDSEAIATLASAESAVGMTQGRLGDLRESLAHYERAVRAGERLLQLEPQSVARRRNLMIAYSHVGDILGLPSHPNMDDPAAAEQPYRKMLAIARQLYDADSQDARSAADYGQALMRLGMVLPASRATDKRAALEQAASLMRSVIEKAPSNTGLKTNVCSIDVQLGHLFRDQPRFEKAAVHYRRAMEGAEPLLESGGTGAVSAFVESARELARLAAAAGRRREAMTLIERVLSVAQARTAPGAGNAARLIESRGLLPRVYAGFFAVHERLGNVDEAARWRARALAAWRELSEPMIRAGYASRVRRELQLLRAAPDEVAAPVQRAFQPR